MLFGVSDEHPAAAQLELIVRHAQNHARKVQHFLAHRHRGGMTRTARDHCAAARERPCAPVKLARVSRHDPHIFDFHSQHIGDELREHREVTLSLRADAGGAANLAAGSIVTRAPSYGPMPVPST